MTTSLDPVPSVRRAVEAYLRLEVKLAQARAIQWDRAPHGGGSGVSRQAPGGYADPTADTVADRPRAEVAAQVRHTEDILRKVFDVLRAETAHLEQAISNWEGKD